ncbi:hypothetical protein VNI00_013307 [Paramarasmius palmivorus]|uniref:Uncharacterized protein n=1 Tax=Paramarasmius palmivorus TaxID=297713 RepID=A0AAW0C1D7_9AGAR
MQEIARRSSTTVWLSFRTAYSIDDGSGIEMCTLCNPLVERVEPSEESARLFDGDRSKIQRRTSHLSANRILLKMPPPTSGSTNIAHSSPSNAVVESALTGTGLPKALILVLFTFTTLYLLIPRLFNWVYPCQSVEELQKMVEDITELITANSCVSNGRNALKNTAGGYKTRLKAFQALVNNLQIKSLNEPNRMNILFCAHFWYTLRKETNEGWFGLRKLKGEIKRTIERNAERRTPIGAPAGFVQRRAHDGDEEREF